MAEVHTQAVPFLRQHLTAVRSPDLAQVGQLVRRLDSPRFAEREEATEELLRMADSAGLALEDALKHAAAPETRRRLQRILDHIESGTPELIRVTRAVEALEAMATPEASQLLADLSRGAAGACLTREAAAASARLEKKHWAMNKRARN
jgi:hypothetical protein